MTRQSELQRQLWFTQPYQVEVREGEQVSVAADSVRVRTLCSAISAGTEMLVYRGQLPEDLGLDASIEGMQSKPSYPLQYGYACVGVVEELGANVAQHWQGKRVFAFAPHGSHFISTCDALIELPEDVEAEDAVFLANMETAVNLVQDGRPELGERVAVLGQGIVGLLLTGVLARFPLQELLAIDGIAERRALAQTLGASATCSGLHLDEQEADLIYEVSGVPEALNSAITLAGYESRIVVGSWYGKKSAAIELGGKAHRNRISITTSQVSSIASPLSGRWSKARRFGVAWQMLRDIRPSRLISQQVPLLEAESIYKQLHETPEKITQAIFVYD